MGKSKPGVYRCAECGHERNLTACAGAIVSGPVAADGELASYDSIDDTGIFEESIQCSEHPQAPLEKFFDGAWCRWWSCPECHGTGRISVGKNWRVPDGWACHAAEDTLIQWPRGMSNGATNGHEGWRPVETAAVA